MGDSSQILGVELRDLRDKISRLRRAAERLRELESALAEEEATFETMVSELNREADDIEGLEKKGLRSFFWKTLGKKEARLQKEKEEFDLLYSRVTSFEKKIKMRKYEIEVLAARVVTLGDLQVEFDEKLHIREDLMSRSPTKEGRRVLELREIIQKTRLSEEEHASAAETGDIIIRQLTEYTKFLKRARDWGRWDMWDSDGGMDDYMKHNQIDKARKSARQIQESLIQYEKQLDVIGYKKRYDLIVEIEKVTRFTDMIFDNPITDWLILRKIKQTLRSGLMNLEDIRRMNQQVHEAMEELAESRMNYTQEMEDLVVVTP